MGSEQPVRFLVLLELTRAGEADSLHLRLPGACGYEARLCCGAEVGGREELSEDAVRGDLIAGERGKQRKDVPGEVELEQLFKRKAIS